MLLKVVVCEGGSIVDGFEYVAAVLVNPCDVAAFVVVVVVALKVD